MAVNCTALVALTKINGMTVSDARFEVDNATLPQGTVVKGAQFSFPVRWNLTTETVKNSENASYGSVTPGIKSTPLTIFTTNAVAGYASQFPLSLSGNQISQRAFFDLGPTTVDFGGIVLGQAGDEAPEVLSPLTLMNRGQNSLTIVGYAYTFDEATDPDAVWVNATFADGVWNLGDGFTSTELPALGTVMAGGQQTSVQLTFDAEDGVGSYLSYFQVYTTGGNRFTILEGSASTAPVAELTISTSEGGWLPPSNTLMDFGPVQPGKSKELKIRICNKGGSVLSISKSKPPLGQIRATLPGIELHESQQIPVNECANGSVVFNPNPEQVNIPDFVLQNTWTLNTDDLDFGVKVINITGVVHDRQVGPLFSNNATARYTYLGCYKDSPRLLPVVPYPSGVQENGRCQQACFDAGYAFAGTEYQQECYCGNKPPEGYRFNSESDQRCTFTCTNDTTQACGGEGGYISIFYDQSKFSPTPQQFDQTYGATAVIPKTVSNYSYVGCYSEGNGVRALAGKNVAQVKGIGGSL
ncbi:hypothetical protein LTS18_012594, partial [Coniosporium uncinatum]